MNYSKFLILILLLSISLEAAYVRSVRVSTQYSQKSANEEAKKLNQFMKSRKNLVHLQNKWDFKVATQKSGKYYLNVIEPIFDKKVLNEVLRTVRTRYPDAYSKRIKAPVITPKVKVTSPVKKLPPVIKKELIVKTIPIVKSIVNVEELIKVVEEVIEEKPPVVEVKPVEKIVKKEKVQPEKKVIPIIPQVIVKEKEKEKEKQKEEVIVQEPQKVQVLKTSQEEMWKMSFFAMSFLFLLSILFLLLSKKKNRKIRNKERTTKTKCEENDMNYSSQIKNNENFLSEAQSSMSSVIQYTNLLLEFDLSVIQKDYVQRIKSSSSSLLNIVNNTSDISKIHVGELEMSMIDFNIRNMISEVSNVIELEANQNHVDLSIDIHEDIPLNVIGDSIHLKQVLISLLTNSVKYTHEGEVTLTLKKIYSYSHAITLSFIVSDTGIGMSHQQIDSIIHARRNNTSTNLSVSKQLIQRMNGDMKIYSTLGVGSTFTFNIKFDLQQ